MMSTSTDIKLLPYDPIPYPVRLAGQRGPAPRPARVWAIPTPLRDISALRTNLGKTQKAFSYDARQHLQHLAPPQSGTLIDTYA